MLEHVLRLQSVIFLVRRVLGLYIRNYVLGTGSGSKLANIASCDV